jgi:HSP20 family protein
MVPDRDDLADVETGTLLREAALGRAFSPATDVYSTDKKVVITVELPGVPENDVAIGADGLTLSVRGRRGFAGPRDGLDYFGLERSYGEFDCQVQLPSRSRPERRTVTFADGVLTVVVPRQ